MPQPWNPPEPRELPALRQALADHVQSSWAHEALVAQLGMGKGTLSPHTGDVGDDATILLSEEHNRLANAVLYYVTADMTRLALAAAETLPVHTFHPHDVPAEAGFLLFAEPIGAYHPEESPTAQADVTTIVAVSWGRSQAVADGTGVWLTFWSLTDYEGEARFLHQHGIPLSKARQRVRSLRAELTWDNEVVLHYGASVMTVSGNRDARPLRLEPIDTEGGWQQVKGTTIEWAQIVRAAWLLMTQPGVTEVDEQQLSKTMRRRAERTGLTPSPVNVVKIRHRENVPTAETPSGRTYFVRWTVRGHWRKQWYPSRGEHRPVWINPHIKGPVDAPLKTSETVHLLDTQ